MVFDTEEKPIDISKVIKRDFMEFHDGMWNGVISLAHADTKREYAMLHIEQFRLKAQTKRFDDSLRILTR